MKHWRLRRQETSVSSDSPALPLPFGELLLPTVYPPEVLMRLPTIVFYPFPSTKKANSGDVNPSLINLSAAFSWPLAKKRMWPERSQLESFSETFWIGNEGKFFLSCWIKSCKDVTSKMLASSSTHPMENSEGMRQCYWTDTETKIWREGKWKGENLSWYVPWFQ